MKEMTMDSETVWHLPHACLTVYIPSPEIIRTITFEPIFCEPDGEHLVPLGQRILDSVEIFPLQGKPRMPGDG